MKKRHFFYLFTLVFLLMTIALMFVLYRSLPANKVPDYQQHVVSEAPMSDANTNLPIKQQDNNIDTDISLSKEVNKKVKHTPSGINNQKKEDDKDKKHSDIIINSVTSAGLADMSTLLNPNTAEKKSNTSNNQKATSAPVNINTRSDIPVNIKEYRQQIEKIRLSAPGLYRKNKKLYQSIDDWINRSLGIEQFDAVGLTKSKVAGGSNYRNVLLTGYYTPIVKARRTPDTEFKYPIYKMPLNMAKLPSRELIYKGVLAGKGLELAYSDSLMGNFMMDIQGSAYIDFEDGTPLVYFSYAGRNGYDYSSLGRVLIERGEVTRNQLSMESVLAWADEQEEEKLKSLLIENRSYIFYNYHANSEVKGSAGVPLVPTASVASDRSLIPTGSVLLVNVPLLDEKGKYQGKNEMRLVVALDTGSAIKGLHLDLYFGTGDKAGKQAGFYSHYAPVWLIK